MTNMTNIYKLLRVRE